VGAKGGEGRGNLNRRKKSPHRGKKAGKRLVYLVKIEKGVSKDTEARQLAKKARKEDLGAAWYWDSGGLPSQELVRLQEKNFLGREPKSFSEQVSGKSTYIIQGASRTYSERGPHKALKVKGNENG